MSIRNNSPKESINPTSQFPSLLFSTVILILVLVGDISSSIAYLVYLIPLHPMVNVRYKLAADFQQSQAQMRATINTDQKVLLNFFKDLVRLILKKNSRNSLFNSISQYLFNDWKRLY